MSTSELDSLPLARGSVIALFSLATFVLVRTLALVAPVAPPEFGARGKRRVEARRSGSFRLLEPVVARLAGLLARLSIPEVRARLEQCLRHASEPMGLCADELLAQALCSAALLGGPSAWAAQSVGMSYGLAFAVVILCGWLPIGRVRALVQERAKQLERSLPTAMDFCVLCMGAGADFPGALRFVVTELGAAHAVCREELSQLLAELSLGRTRVEALAALGQRTGSAAVRELVATLCRSEEKGTPLIDALTIQSTTLRQRRSVRAEELAAKARVKMMVPLMLMMGCLLLIVFGPMIATGMGL